MRINSQTRLCGIIGKPVDHSMSPAIHNAAFQQKNLNYIYLAFNVDAPTLGDAIRSMRALHIRGFSVTMPHKRNVISFLDEVDPVAGRIGAVNTVVNDDGYLKGYNTDWKGFLRSLKQHTTVAGKKVVILGAGGAARAIGFGIRQEGGQLSILNRASEVEMAQALAGELQCDYNELSAIDTVIDADIVVQATSVGMPPLDAETIIDPDVLRPSQVIYDIVYNPIETTFLKLAKARGCRIIHGYEMLLYQGVEQFELWTQQEAPVDLMRNVLIEQLSGRKEQM